VMHSIKTRLCSCVERKSGLVIGVPECVKWNPYQDDATTQGREDLKTEYRLLFDHCLPNLEDEIHLKRVEL